VAKNDCGDIKKAYHENDIENLDVEQEADYEVDSYYHTEIENEPAWRRVLQSLRDKMKDRRGPITQKDLDRAIKRYYGSKEKYLEQKAKYVINLNALLRTHGALRGALWETIQYYLLQGGIKDIGVEERQIDGKMVKVPILENLPLSTLKNLYRIAWEWTHAGKELNIMPGRIGDMQLEVLTPRNIARRESTGAIYKVTKSTEKYSAQYTVWGNGYMDETPGKKYSYTEPTADMGYRYIIEQVRNLSTRGEHKISSDTMGTVFFWTMLGKVSRIDGEGKVFVYKDRVPVPGKFHHDGNQVYEWRGETEYIKDGKQVQIDTKKMINPETSKRTDPSNLDLLLKYISATSDLHEKVYNDSSRRMGKQTIRYKSLEAKMKEAVKNKKMSPEVYDMFTYMFTDPTGTAGFNVMGYKEKYSPILFHIPEIPLLVEEKMNEMIAKHDEYADLIKGTSLSTKERVDLKQKQNKIWLQIEQARQVIDYATDTEDVIHWREESSVLILSRQSLKHFKPISNLISPNNARTDEFVFEDYVSSIAKTFQRNEVTMDLIEALLMNDDPGAQTYAIELYKTTFNYPDAKSTLLTIPMDTVRMTSMFHKVGIDVPISTIKAGIKALSAAITGNLLVRPMAGLRNWTANINKIHDVGATELVKAFQLYHGKEGDKWRRLAHQWGVINFVDYLEGFLIHTIRPKELAAAREVITELRKRIRTGDLHPETYLRYRKMLRKEWFKTEVLTKLDAWAQFAIKHQPGARSEDGHSPKLLKAMGGLGWLYKMVPSMQQTEMQVRTVSFIIGVRHAINEGYATEESSAEAARFGAEYAMLSDHFMQQQSVGYIGHGDMGVLNSKLKLWSIQRFGTDYKINTRAKYGSLDYYITTDKKGNEKLKTKGKTMAFIQMVNALFGAPLGTKGSRVLRKEFPEYARFRSLSLIQGLLTLTFEFFLFGPGGLLLIKKLYNLGMKSSGGTGRAFTGLISDMYSLTFIMATMFYAVTMATIGGKSEDDENWWGLLTKAFRHTHVGVFPGMIWELIASLAHDKSKLKQIEKGRSENKHIFYGPLIPGGDTSDIKELIDIAKRGVEGVGDIVD